MTAAPEAPAQIFPLALPRGGCGVTDVAIVTPGGKQQLLTPHFASGNN